MGQEILTEAKTVVSFGTRIELSALASGVPSDEKGGGDPPMFTARFCRNETDEGWLVQTWDKAMSHSFCDASPSPFASGVGGGIRRVSRELVAFAYRV
jgi:hypothetical protein